jgi:hypothetical protein
LKPPKLGPYVSSYGGVVRWTLQINMSSALTIYSPEALKTVSYLINRSGYHIRARGTYTLGSWHRMPIKDLLDYLGSKATIASVQAAFKELIDADRYYGGDRFLSSGSKIEGDFIDWVFSTPVAEDLENPKRYGKLDLDVLRKLTSFEAIRLYQVMTEREDSEQKSTWQPTIAELKEKLGRKPEERFYNFNDRILKPAIKQLNDVKAFGVAGTYPGAPARTLTVEYIRAKAGLGTGRGRKLAFVKFSFHVPPRVKPERPEPVEKPVEIALPTDDIMGQILAGEIEIAAPVRDAEFEAAAARYFGLIEGAIQRRASAAENEMHDQTREYLIQIARRLRITLESEKLACQTHHRWVPPVDLRNIDEFSGRLMDEQRVIDYGDPKPERAAVTPPPAHQVAYIKQRNYGLRRRIQRPRDEEKEGRLLALRFHALPAGETKARCGAFARYDEKQVSRVFVDRRHWPLWEKIDEERLQERAPKLAHRIMMELAPPKHWVVADAGTEVNCPKCRTILKGEAPSTRPILRRRPAKNDPA